jgi:hypothetical protein
MADSTNTFEFPSLDALTSFVKEVRTSAANKGIGVQLGSTNVQGAVVGLNIDRENWICDASFYEATENTAKAIMRFVNDAARNNKGTVGESLKEQEQDSEVPYQAPPEFNLSQRGGQQEVTEIRVTGQASETVLNSIIRGLERKFNTTFQAVKTEPGTVSTTPDFLDGFILVQFYKENLQDVLIVKVAEYKAGMAEIAKDTIRQLTIDSAFQIDTVSKHEESVRSRARRLVEGSVVQKFMFKLDKWTKLKALKWVAEHGYSIIDTSDPGYGTYHIQVRKPTKGARYSTVPFGDPSKGLQATMMWESLQKEDLQKSSLPAHSSEALWKIVKEMFGKVNASEVGGLKFPVDQLDGVALYLVEGDWVKERFLMDFVEGGHDKVYDFIPSKEVWVDHSMEPANWPFIAFHELVERHLMEHDGLDYDAAHNRANNLERWARKGAIGTAESAGTSR